MTANRPIKYHLFIVFCSPTIHENKEVNLNLLKVQYLNNLGKASFEKLIFQIESQ